MQPTLFFQWIILTNKVITVKYLPYTIDLNLKWEHFGNRILRSTDRLFEQTFVTASLGCKQTTWGNDINTFCHTFFPWNITFPTRIAFLSATVTVSNVTQTLLNVSMWPQTASDLVVVGRRIGCVVHSVYPQLQLLTGISLVRRTQMLQSREQHLFSQTVGQIEI